MIFWRGKPVYADISHFGNMSATFHHAVFNAIGINSVISFGSEIDCIYLQKKRAYGRDNFIFQVCRAESSFKGTLSFFLIFHIFGYVGDYTLKKSSDACGNEYCGIGYPVIAVFSKEPVYLICIVIGPFFPYHRIAVFKYELAVIGVNKVHVFVVKPCSDILLSPAENIKETVTDVKEREALFTRAAVISPRQIFEH